MKTRILTTLTLALLAGTSHANDHATHFDKPNQEHLIIERLKQLEQRMDAAGISPQVANQVRGLYQSHYRTMQNGDAENAEVTCKDFGYGNLDEDNGNKDCNDFPLDYSNTTADMLFFYHPKWADAQKSKGQAYKAILKEVEKTNTIFGHDTPVKIRLVGFEQPTIAGYEDFQRTMFSGSYPSYDDMIATGMIDELPNSYDLYTQRSGNIYDFSTTPVTYIPGPDNLLQIARYFAGRVYNGRYNYDDLPEDSKMMLEYGADIFGWGRLREVEFDPTESSTCGWGGTGGPANILLTANTLEVSDTHCRFVLAHEIGHAYMADHDKDHNPQNPLIPRTRATAAPCGNSHTVMFWAAKPDLKPFLSSPNVIVDGTVCGDERTMNNAKQVTIAAPFMANIMDTMTTVGEVWFATSAINVDEKAGSIAFTVSRNGDLSKPTSVKVFIDEGYKLLGEDFFDVKFGAGESTKTVTTTVLNNTSTNDNPVLKAELVTPRLLSVDQNKGTLEITVKNDDEKPVTPPTPPTPTPSPDKSSGGAMGYLALLILAGVRLFRN